MNIIDFFGLARKKPGQNKVKKDRKVHVIHVCLFCFYHLSLIFSNLQHLNLYKCAKKQATTPKFLYFKSY